MLEGLTTFQGIQALPKQVKGNVSVGSTIVMPKLRFHEGHPKQHMISKRQTGADG